MYKMDPNKEKWNALKTKTIQRNASLSAASEVQAAAVANDIKNITCYHLDKENLWEMEGEDLSSNYIE